MPMLISMNFGKTTTAIMPKTEPKFFDMKGAAIQVPFAKSFADNVIPRIPMRRWGKPADMGGIAVYLTSDASSWHTGDIITIDGGYSVF